MAVGDFTGDGVPDLVTGQLGTPWRVSPAAATAVRPPLSHAHGLHATVVAVADFNGDGKLDRGRRPWTWLPSACSWATGTAPWPCGRVDDRRSHRRPSRLGDFNGDGRPDVAAANGGSSTPSRCCSTTAPGVTPSAATPAQISIGDVTVTEGNTGTRAATFTVTLSAASTQTVTVAYATGNGTATAGSDYQAASGTLTFAPGETSKTITVLVNGDRLGEPNETFFVNLSSPTNATIADGQGVGTIVDDEPRISISDVTKAEGKKGQTTLFTFTVTLSAAYDQAGDDVVPHRERHRHDERRRLRRQDRHADLRPRRDDEDDHDRGQGRQQEGGRRVRSTSTCSATAATRCSPRTAASARS